MSTPFRAPSPLLLALVAAAGVSCGGNDTNSPSSLAGAFALTAVDGNPLPATLTGQGLAIPITITADTLVLTELGTFEQRTVAPGQLPLQGGGDFTLRGDSLFLMEENAGALIARGVVAGSDLHLRSFSRHAFPDHDWTYARAQ